MNPSHITRALQMGWNLATKGQRRQRIRRHLNRKRNTREKIQHATHLKSWPQVLYLDPATMCNLRCPFCPTGSGDLEFPKMLLRPPEFYRIVESIPTDLLETAHLYNWGESLLNPHLSEYIEYFSSRGIHTWISTNFSLKEHPDTFHEDLVRSGLGVVIVSIDGASQETYGKYRVGGNFERVIGNMRGLTAAKERLSSETPTILYRMLINRFNQDDVESAKALADEVGAEFLPDENFYIPTEHYDEWVADSVREKFQGVDSTIYGHSRSEPIHTECRQLWDTLLVGPEGSVLPCCVLSDSATAVGNLLEEPLKAIWNSERMVTLRRYVTDAEAAPPSFTNGCEECSQRDCLYTGA